MRKNGYNAPALIAFLATGLAASASHAGGCLGFVPSSFDAGADPRAVAVGDLDGDGDLDLAIAGDGGVLRVLKNDGSAQFDPAIAFTAGLAPRSLALGDLDGDGDLDAAIADEGIFNYGLDHWENQGVVILLNDGSGTFGAAELIPFGIHDARPESVALGDFDADGDLDIVTALMNSPTYPYGEIAVLLNDGPATFQPVAYFLTGNGSISVALADLNADGILDAITANYGSASLSIMHGDGEGGFVPGGSYAGGPWPRWVSVGDLNGNGVPDLAVINHYSLRVILDGTLLQVYSLGLGKTSVVLGDLDGDGDLDAVVPETLSDAVRVLLNNGAGAFTEIMVAATGGAPYRAAIDDLDGDGVRDIVFTDVALGTVTVLANTCGSTPDLNGDGIVDGADLGLLLASWGGAGDADLDGNGEVDGADLGLLLAAWSG